MPHESGIPERLYHRARSLSVSLLRAEAAILIALALYLASASIFKRVTHPGALGGEIAFALLGSIGLFLCSLSYSRGTSWGRSPAVLANLIALGVSYFMFGSHLYVSAIPLLLLAATTLAANLLGYRPQEAASEQGDQSER
jgi:multisubunit Na+/H+ antiporter MnhG subunit